MAKWQFLMLWDENECVCVRAHPRLLATFTPPIPDTHIQPLPHTTLCNPIVSQCSSIKSPLTNMMKSHSASEQDTLEMT